GDLLVDPIIEPGPVTTETAALAARRFRNMPMLSGLLASPDGDMLVAIVPVVDPNHAVASVTAVRDIAEKEAAGVAQVHVAGVAAMNARLATMVDTDTRIFIPVAIVTVLLILLFALRRPAALIGPLFVIACSAAVAIGLMGWLGSRYYLITTALPVVIMAIAVADSLHISIFYLRSRRVSPQKSAREAASEALGHTLVPVSLTSLTTIAAFLGLSLGAAMQPISEFGIYAAIGVAAAWLFSLTALPAIMILTDLRPGAGPARAEEDTPIGRAIAVVSSASFARPKTALLLTFSALALLSFFALRADFDYERQRYFVADDPVRIADESINARLGGMNFLDVMVSAPTPGGLMTPAAIQAIAELRSDMASLPLVSNVTGIDSYLSLMHAVLTGGSYGELPTSERGPGQYMFLYETAGAPEDFKRDIDYNHTRALVRAQLSTDSYRDTLPVIRALERQLEGWHTRSGLDAQISGRVAVNDGWMSQLAANHFVGLGVASALVFLTTLVIFRSAILACLAVIPVFVGVVTVYATMGLFGIDIAPATSMTAAIATGLGVDFGIHLVSQLRKQLGLNPDAAAITGDYIVVARACFWSAVALGLALAVICISSAPPLRWFGVLVAVGALGSLVGALVMLPALIASTSFITQRSQTHAAHA
ncbi:MAG: MMPL family transporter, partial [Chromatocurvus sp.]